jgi:hypothetical protein
MTTFTVLLCASAAQAAQPAGLAQAQARYLQDMAACNSGPVNPAAATCRREATNALAAAKHGDLDNATENYQQNALQRCAVHKGDERTACETRILNQGDITSAARAGGLLRQSITIVPAN